MDGDLIQDIVDFTGCGTRRPRLAGGTKDGTLQSVAEENLDVTLAKRLRCSCLCMGGKGVL
jgi:hypothetical protein